jgi:hypothetical protein
MTITRKNRSVKRRRRGGKSIRKGRGRRTLKGGVNSQWFDYETLIKDKKVNKDDICPLCQEELSKTSDRVIYKLTCCGQFVHNDCLLDYCDDKSKKQLAEFRSNVAAGNRNLPSTIQMTCPMCRKEEGDLSKQGGYCGFSCDCMEVSAFKGKDFDNDHIERMLGKGSRVLAMYHSQH